MEKKEPLKRHPALVPLSKDHHFGLLLCWKIRTGLKKDIPRERIVNYVLYFFNHHLKQHFWEEEQYIFSLLDESDPMRLKAETQHGQIRRLVEILSERKIGQEPLEAVEKALNDHIRFEERKLFPYVQDTIAEIELQELGEKIDAIHQMQADDWEDPFWL